MLKFRSNAVTRGAWSEVSLSWFFTDILAPFSITRIVLLAAGWFSQYFPPFSRYPVSEAIEQGWQFSRYRLLDIWGRWDSGWYMSIVREGYIPSADISTSQSNLAFFPLYPYLVKFLLLFIPPAWQTTGVILLVGIIVSNLFLLCALALLYRLVQDMTGDTAAARRTVLYLVLFPTSFFFSSFYTESVFLFFSVAAFYAASKRAWGAASLAGFFLALSRPLGILILIPLVWMYFESIDWKISKIRWSFAWFLLVPGGLLIFFLIAYAATGDWLAPMLIQSSWGKQFPSLGGAPFKLPVASRFPYISFLERGLTVAFLALGMLAFYKFRSKSYPIYVLLLILPPLLTASIVSMSRYVLIAFPVFIVLALFGKNRLADQIVTLLFFGLQVLLMAAWAQFYWVA